MSFGASMHTDALSLSQCVGGSGVAGPRSALLIKRLDGMCCIDRDLVHLFSLWVHMVAMHTAQQGCGVVL